jgi:hypothetical protein
MRELTEEKSKGRREKDGEREGVAEELDLWTKRASNFRVPGKPREGRREREREEKRREDERETERPDLAGQGVRLMGTGHGRAAIAVTIHRNQWDDEMKKGAVIGRTAGPA